MDVGLLSRVGLQLLLEPQSTAFLFTGACVAAGTVYPAYASYKALVAPHRPPAPAAAATTTVAATSSPASASSVRWLHSLAAERWLRYWVVYGGLLAAERALGGDAQLAAWVPCYPHLKLAFLLWLQADGGRGAALLFERHIGPRLAKYERKIDVLLELGAQLAAHLRSTYAGPIGALSSSLTLAGSQTLAFLRWISTPDDAPPPVPPTHLTRADAKPHSSSPSTTISSSSPSPSTGRPQHLLR